MEYRISKVRLIWPMYKQHKLIDSILKNLSIGLLFLKEIGDKYEVLDGQQRLKTIRRFIKNEFKTSPDFTKEFPNKSFKDLQNDTGRYSRFNAFEVYYTLVVKGKESEISDIFLRLQEGTPLNTPEKLNAILGKMRDFVVNISRHQLFHNIPIRNHRFSHRHIAAQVALLELNTNFQTQSFPDLRFKDLSEVYEKYRLKLAPSLHRRIHGTLNFLYSSLAKDAKVIRKKSDLPLVYILASYLRKKYVVGTRPFSLEFRNFIVNFFTEVEQAPIYTEKENIYSRYKELRTGGLSAATFRERFEILLGTFLAEVPDIYLKDEKRGFDFGQKLAIYYQKDEGICQFCKKEVEWEDASFHHAEFHSRGGRTTVENGQLMHKRCHDKFHNKKGPDTDI